MISVPVTFAFSLALISLSHLGLTIRAVNLEESESLPLCLRHHWLADGGYETKHRSVVQAPEEVGGSEAAAVGVLGKWKQQDIANDIVNVKGHLMYARFFNTQR